MAEKQTRKFETEAKSLRALARHGENPPLVAGVPARVHLLGAGGAGLSGAALVLHARGHALSGHDRADSRFVRSLRVLGMPIDLGESKAELLPADVGLVARSAAVQLDDPQVVEAVRRGIPVIKYSELLGRLAPERRTIAVAGTHGKTTTSWLAYYALRGLCEAAGRGAPTPGALIGGACRELASNAVPPQFGGWFAAEACEYDRSFLQLSPEGAIVTNVEPDHLDYYGTFAAIEEAFARFVDRVHPDGLLVVGRDVPEKITAASPCTVWRLGREIHVDLLGEQHGFFRFRLRGPGFATPEVKLEIPGSFNVENAALALALSIGLVGRQWKLDLDQAADAAARSVHRYKGAERRFEPWGTHGGVEVIHDYAHHPPVVRATLEAARRALPGKPLHVLFQPHQHSRTARFIDDFVESLRAADRVVVAEVYGARAHIDRMGAGAEDLVLRLKRANLDAVFGGAPSQSVQALAERAQAGVAALVLGAGDIDLYKDELVKALGARRPLSRPTLR
ncbi:MAG: UDP-N-acetylmuramate--L-alanine ligase [Planctomycetes bacterium]|nr:UDP-N-acetylmuramate--L-alanine ligase [Planctomycetota bacterium]